MSSSAIIMLLVAVVLIWGGLGIALVHLSRNPDESGAEEEPAEAVAPWSNEA